ncbi:hypothetical protein [Mesorhizobium sp. ISC11]|uniref:hypothetical protein n=1 Tax=Mesorhizobium sp. ISC11 TaxID=3076428 RepID=UPI00301DF486
MSFLADILAEAAGDARHTHELIDLPPREAADAVPVRQHAVGCVLYRGCHDVARPF